MSEPPLSAIDLNLLVALEALLRTGSVSAAAEQVNLSQPAMSRTLARLRDLFDDPLLVRVGRSMKPTPRAEALRAPLLRALAHVREVLETPAHFDPSRSSRNFRILSSDYTQVAVLGHGVELLAGAAPAASLSVLPIRPRALDLLAAGRADLWIGPRGPFPAWARTEPLLDDPWLCVRSVRQPLPRTPTEYLEAAHIAVAAEADGAGAVDAALAAEGKERRVSVRVADFAGALFLTATSTLLATLPAPVAHQGAALLPLRVGALPFSLPTVEIVMAWSAHLDADPAHRWLRDIVRASVHHARQRDVQSSVSAPKG